MTTDPAVLALWAWLLPAGAFLLLALDVPLRRSGRPGAYLSILAALGSLGAALAGWRAAGPEDAAAVLSWTWLAQHDGALTSVGVLADGQSLVMLVLVALVASLVQIYSLGYLSDESPASLGRYYLYQSLFAFSMMGLVLAPNFVQLFICWELVGLCSYLLIGFWYQKPAAARAAVKAFWMTKAGDVGLLVGIVLLWGHAGTFDFGELQQLAAAGLMPAAGLSLITFCLYLGPVGKSAQFPLHVWLPDAMEGPTPVSALIHAATMVTAGVYLMVRTAWLFALTPDVLVLVGWIGALTALLAAVLACAQTDIKRVLAYSTVSQLGYMMAAVGAGFAAAGFLHLLTHGVFKALLFLGAGAVIHAVGSNELSRMGGLFRQMPQTAIVFLIGTLSLAGIPLFAGFLSKEEILAGVWAGGLTVPFAMLVAAAFLTAFYMFRVVFVAFFAPAARGDGGRGHGGRGFSPGVTTPPLRAEPPGQEPPGAHDEIPHPIPHDPHLSMALPLWVLAILSVGIGVRALVVHHEPVAAAPAWLMPLAVLVAGAGVLLAWLTYQRRVVSADRLAGLTGPLYPAALAGFWLDDLFAALYRGVLLGLSRLAGWVDRYLVDGVLNVLTAWTVDGSDRLRRIQTGRAQDYVYGVTVGLLLLVFWFGWTP